MLSRPVVSRLYTGIDDECEPVPEPIIDFSDEIFEFSQ